MVTLFIGSFIWVLCWLELFIFFIIMDTPITHINLFNAVLALYVIGYQLSICIDWSWIPMNKEDYQLPYQDKWSRIN